MRYEVTLRMRPLTRLERLWYWRLRMTVPRAVSGSTTGQWVRHLPQSWTWIHRRHARRRGLFWLPCVLCGRYSGGHQWGDSVPDPTYSGPGQMSIGICPKCSRDGRGWRVSDPFEDVLNRLADKHDHGHVDWVTDCLDCFAHHAALIEAFDRHYGKEES